MKKTNEAISFALVVCVGVGMGQAVSEAQDVVSDRVSITSRYGQLFGITSREGIARQELRAGERVLALDAKGMTGFVQTSTRLLGFSGKLQRWVPITLSTAERILKWTVTSRMVIVEGSQSTYGFQSDRGRWKREAWGAGESRQTSAIEDFIAVIVTDRRALGFSAVTGGFSPRDLPVDNQIHEIQINDNIAVLHLSDFTLVFRSGLAIWAKLP